MNKNIAEEELLLRKRARRRLVGAIVLVLAAVIFLPMIFDEPKPDTEKHEIDIHLFPKDDVTASAPLVVPSDNALGETPPEYIDQTEFDDAFPSVFTDVPMPADPTARPEPLESLGEPVQALDGNEKRHIPIPGIKPRLDRSPTQMAGQRVTEPASIQTQAPVAIERPALTQQPGTYVVQLGAFADQAKAQQQQNALMSKGFNAYTETHVVNGNVMTRVRVGPFANRAGAQAELDKLRRLGQDGVITTQ